MPGEVAETKERVVKALLQGCNEKDFAKEICPVCGSALELVCSPHKKSFVLRCSRTSLHLHTIRWMDEKVPSWWETRVELELLDR